MAGLFGNENEINIVHTAFQKIRKNTCGGLELLTSIYYNYIKVHSLHLFALNSFIIVIYYL